MEYRVKDLLNLETLKNATVMCGHNHLNNVIKGVTIMEAPDIYEWIKGGEVILTSLYPIRNFTGEEQKDFVGKLFNKKVSALIVKSHRFVEEIPAALLTEGRKVGLPIIRIPKEIPYVDIMYPLMSELFNKQVKKLEYFKEIHDLFTLISLADEGPEEIIKTLEKLINNPVALFDRNFRCITTTDPILSDFEIVEKIPYYEQTNEIKFPHYRQIVKYKNAQQLSGYQIVVPIETLQHTRTYLLIGEIKKPLETLEFIAVENAATALSLELVKQFAVGEVEKKFKNDLIDDLVTGRIQSWESVHQKAKVFGWDLEGTFVALLFKISFKEGGHAGERNNAFNRELSFIYEDIRKLLQYGIMMIKSNTVIVLWKINESGKEDTIWIDNVKKTAVKIQNVIKKQYKHIVVQAGIGNKVESIKDIERSYREAQEALDIGKTVFGEGAVTLFSELGIYRLLCNFDDPAYLSTYIPPSLKKLLNYSHANRDDLIETLKIFLQCNQNTTKTSQLLYLHYKTVVYRLERIKEITGMDFNNSEEMLSVQVGLKIVELFDRKKQQALEN